jgi:hypothetical protein
MPGAPSSESGADDGGGIAIVIIPLNIERVVVIEPIGTEAIKPGVIVGRKIGLVGSQRAGISGIDNLTSGILLIIPGGFLLVKGPVTTGEGSRDQDKVDAGGFFHVGC